MLTAPVELVGEWVLGAVPEVTQIVATLSAGYSLDAPVGGGDDGDEGYVQGDEAVAGHDGCERGRTPPIG